MIRFEHANLVVKDIDATLAFIQAAFPTWRIRGRGANTWHGKPRRWLHVGDDNYYVTLNDGAESEGRDLSGHTPGLAHLGFVVDDVDGVIERLEAKGFQMALSGGEHPFRKTVYFIEPTGIEFEFMEYLSDKPSERNQYQSNGTMTVDSDYVAQAVSTADA